MRQLDHPGAPRRAPGSEALRALLVVLGLALAVLALGSTAARATTTPPGPSPAQTGATPPPAGGVVPSAPVAPEDGPAIQVQVVGPTGRLGGVKVEVLDSDEQVLASAETSAEKLVVIPLPGPATVSVKVDEDTLPDGLSIVSDNPITDRSVTTRPLTVIFRAGDDSGASSGPSRWDRVPQLLADGIRFGLVIAMSAVGLSLIFGTTGLTNFAHGELVTLGAVFAYYFHMTLGLPLLVAAPVAVVLGGVVGLGNDRLLWRPLRRRGTGLIAMLVVSIGLSLLLRSIIQFFFGGGTRTYRDFSSQREIEFANFGLRPKDLVSMVLCIVVLVGIALLLQRTRFGTAVRAVADNGALASSSGIDTNRVITIVWVAGAALAALGGILQASREGVNFETGFQLLLLIFAAVTLGGLGTAYGALVGSLVVGLFISLSTLYIPLELRTVGALGILIVVLLIRPQGILGSRERVG